MVPAASPAIRWSSVRAPAPERRLRRVALPGNHLPRQGGIATFLLERPSQCLLRGDLRILGPEAPCERDGDVPNVAFPCGYTIADDGDALFLYHGAADTSLALATGSSRERLAGLDRHAAGTVIEPVLTEVPR